MRPTVGSALALALAVGPTTAHAGLLFSKTDYPTPCCPVAVAVADLNGDGLLDLVSSNDNSNSVSVRLGIGSGSFGPRADFTTGAVPDHFAIADVNLDGKLDLMAGNRFGNSVSVLLGNGNGTFAPRNDYPTGDESRSVAAGDLNGDGLPDLAVTNSDAATITLLLGTGGGHFAGGGTLPTGGYPVSVAMGDLNADGKLDLVVANTLDIQVYLGNGNGTFQPRQHVPTSDDAPSFVAIGELNGDGKPDLALAILDVDGPIAMLFGNGDGTFGSYHSLPAGGSVIGGSYGVAIGDLNNDGKADLAAPLGAVASDVYVALGNGDGSFAHYSHFPTGTYALSVAMADVSGDGWGDLVVGNRDSQNASVLINQSNIATSTSLTSDVNPSACAAFTLTATVTPAGATGSVTFLEGASEIGTAPLNGSGVATLPCLRSNGSYTLRARYDGDDSHALSLSSPYSQTVATSTALSLTSDVNPSVCGDRVTLTATTSPPTSTGTLTFYSGTQLLGSAPLDATGRATLALQAELNHGTISVTARLDDNGCLVTSPAYQQDVSVTPSSVVLTTDRNPIRCGESVTIDATVTPPVDGTMQFFDALQPVGAAPVIQGHASLIYAPPGTYNHELTARFLGADCVGPSTSLDVMEYVLANTSVALSSGANPSVCGNPAMITATVSPATVTGSVTFYWDSFQLGVATVDGTGHASLPLPSTNSDSMTITGHFNGNGCDLPSDSPAFIQHVARVATSVALTASPSPALCTQRVHLDAAVSPAVTGYVEFFDGESSLGIAQVNQGHALYSLQFPGTASHSLAARYLGDVCTAESQSSPINLDVDCSVAVSLVRLDSESSDAGVVVRWKLSEALASLVIERADAADGPWVEIHPLRHDEADVSVAIDATVQPGHDYWYRLVGSTASGTSAVFGPIQARAAAPLSFELSAPWPNPTAGDVSVGFALPRAAAIRLSVVDLQGREIRVLASGMMEAGRYQATWDGRTDHGRASEGIYFVRYLAPDIRMTKRVAIAR